jgi:hypothetical protein
VGLGVLAGPLALLPLIDLGDAPSADCKALYAGARVDGGASARVTSRSKSAQPATVRRAAD